MGFNLSHIFTIILLFQSSPEDMYRAQFLENPEANKSLFRWLSENYRVSRRFDDAIALCDSALSLVPDDTLFVLSKIRFQLDAGYTDAALKEGERFLELERNRDGYAKLARMFKAKGYPQIALRLWRRSREELGIDYLFAREFYLKALNEKDYLVAVREALNTLLEGESVRWVTREVKRLRKFLGAEKCRDEVAKWVKGHREVKEGHVILGKLLLDDGKFSEASRELRAAEDEEGLLELADKLSYEGLFSLGLDVLSWLPDTLRGGFYYCILGRTLKGLKRFEEAADAFLRSYEFGGSWSDEALEGLMQCYLDDMNRPEEALRLEPLWGDDFTGYRAKALFMLGNPDSALALFDAKGEDIRPEDRFFQGELLFYAGRIQEADSVLKEFIRELPDAEEVTQALFYLEVIVSLSEAPGFRTYVALERDLALKKFDEVIENARKAMSQEEDTVLRALEKYTMARAIAALNRPGEAITVLKEIGEESPNYVGARALFEAYRVAQSIGDLELGDEILEELILKFPDSPYAQVARSYL